MHQGHKLMQILRATEKNINFLLKHCICMFKWYHQATKESKKVQALKDSKIANPNKPFLFCVPRTST